MSTTETPDTNTVIVARVPLDQHYTWGNTSDEMFCLKLQALQSYERVFGSSRKGSIATWLHAEGDIEEAIYPSAVSKS